ncbi:MAG TPA: Fur family transcriptional regulator [Solirubrobacterales bacterium]|nr:Fur family transcriptional regulator [Solirubrobacterales bacterium]
MRSESQKGWAEHALSVLAAAGLRRGGARLAVVEALERQDCAVTALEIDDDLRRRTPGVGRASVYRALEQLEQLGLVQRLEVSRGTAGYERVEPSGQHHHHAICRHCGRMVPFEDSGLERAIGRVSERMRFEVTEHDVVLRGLCEHCGNLERLGSLSSAGS